MNMLVLSIKSLDCKESSSGTVFAQHSQRETTTSIHVNDRVNPVLDE